MVEGGASRVVLVAQRTQVEPLKAQVGTLADRQFVVDVGSGAGAADHHAAGVGIEEATTQGTPVAVIATGLSAWA